MKIEIILTDVINEICTNSSCFDASIFIANTIKKQKSICGIVIINNETVKFNFSPQGLDGDIFTNNVYYRRLIKSLIPLYVHTNMNI